MGEFRSAEDLILSYWKLSNFLTTASSVDIASYSGYGPAKRCKHCRGKEYVRRGDHLFCRKCSSDWPRERLVLRRGEVQENKRQGRGANGALVELTYLGTVLKKARAREQWGFDVLVVCCLGGMGHRRVAAYGRVHWPDAPFMWNKDKVRRLRNLGKRIVEEEYEMCSGGGEKVAKTVTSVGEMAGSSHDFPASRDYSS